MKYSRVAIDAFGYELPPNVITSDDIELRLEPAYQRLKFQKGQLEAITGIRERRFWDPGFKMSDGAVIAGAKALETGSVAKEDIGMLIFAGVCRDNLEPATACAVAHGLGLSPETLVYDVSNACLGVLNGMVDVANAIELGQIKAGLVVSCETARQIVDTTITRLLANPDMDTFKKTVATLTGGSGSVAVLLTEASLSIDSHCLLGGAAKNAVRHHELCIWGPATGEQIMETDSVGVLNNGVVLGVDTYAHFKDRFNLSHNQPDKVICHQVGSTHQRTILDAVKIPMEKDFTTFRFLGNMGTVSLPLTAAIAHERDFLLPGDMVGLLGIGSGLNCLILGVRW